jgi:threonine dehydrogenase-like Zn-dependent dehydrogenase
VARLVGQRRFDVVRQVVGAPEDGRVRIRILTCGVCASELHAWSEVLDAYPIRIGHEPVGVVEAVGSGVDGLWPGQAVTGGFGPAFSERVIVDPGVVVPIPEGVSTDDVLGEPLGCVMEARRRTPLEVGHRIALVGAGYMGLLMLEILRVSGAGYTLVVDPRRDALHVARELGAEETAAPDEVSDGEVDRGFDLVIEATGTQAGLDLATRLASEHGALTILGYHQGPPRSVDVQAWNWKALEVINGHVRRRDLLNEAIRRGLELVRLGRIAPKRLVTHRFELERVGQAFAMLEDKPEGFIKAVVTIG